MQKFSAFLKEYKTLLAIALLVALLSGINLALPEKSAVPEEMPPAPVQSPEPVSADSEGEVIISEFMVKNHSALLSPEGDFTDWAELKNVGSEQVCLRGWSISDGPEKEGYMLPELVLAPGQELIVYLAGKNGGQGLRADFALSQGEELVLRDAKGELRSSALCPEAPADTAFCLQPEGGFAPSLYPSPGFPNTPEGYEAFQQSLSVSGPLIINEVQTANLAPGGSSAQPLYDWVEIKNISSESVELSDYCLSDDEDDYYKWQFPSMLIHPGEIKLVCCDEDMGGSAYDGRFYAGFSLNSSSEQLYLSREGQLQDYASLRDIPYLCSCGRLPGENGWFYLGSPSPGDENSGGFRRVSQSPEVLSGDGVSEGVSSVTVELSAVGDIYYTTDGSRPTADSLKYQGPIKVKETCVIRAVAIEPGAMPSRVLDVSPIINEGHSLPVMSLVADSVSGFEGMYGAALKGVELPGSLSLYEEDGGFKIPCGIKIHGETSRVLPKKNMSVRFRGAYGQDRLQYDVYGGGVREFSNFVLRAGQDFYSGIIRNEFCQNLALSASEALISQRSKYCVLYINGRYSGIYNLMEKANEQHYADLAGVSRDSVQLMESEVGFESEIYQDVFLYCMQNDMSLPESYEHFCSLVDIDSFIDWILLQGYCANNDLTYGNLRYCRSPEADGKWRLMFYDLDSSFYLVEQSFDLLSPYALSSRQVSQLIKPLMENPLFRDRLLSRAGELLRGPLSTEKVLEEFDRLRAEVAPEVERDYQRFGMSLEKWQWNTDYIRELIAGGRWNNAARQRLSEIFSLSPQEREKYFG